MAQIGIFHLFKFVGVHRQASIFFLRGIIVLGRIQIENTTHFNRAKDRFMSRHYYLCRIFVILDIYFLKSIKLLRVYVFLQDFL